MTKLLGIVFSPFVHLLSFCFYKRKDIWCFGAWFGEKYADNSKYLFEYTVRNANKHNVTGVWITSNEDLAKEIRKKGYQAYSKYSAFGLWYQLVCKVFICTVNSRDFYFATLTRRNIIIQLWHGVPFKKIGYDAEVTRLHKAWTMVRSFFIDHYSLIISPSRTFDPLFCSAFGVGEDRILRAGYPRNDGLFLTPEDRGRIRSQFGATDQKQLLVYLPTHRGEGKHSEKVYRIIDQFVTLGAKIREQNVVVLIKPHFYDIKEGLSEKSCSGVNVVDSFGEWDLYQVLAASDGLITDYSSVFLDYEIIKKPVYFLAPDLHWYVSKDRGMYFSYSSFAKKHCENVEGLLNSIKENEDHLSCVLEINEDKDGNYSHKLFEKLLSII